MTRLRHRWLVWLLAAWLPVAGIAAASASQMMLSMSLADNNESAQPGRGEHAGCHEHTMTDAQPGGDGFYTADRNTAQPCCQSGACFCNCGTAASALPVVLPLLFSPTPASELQMAAEFILSAPPAHPFRPPIV